MKGMKDILERAKELLQGKKVLFVSNRPDKRLQKKLADELGIEVDWKDVERVSAAQTASDRIKNGQYDLVFVATSFVSHKSDKVVKAACKSSETRYVPVNKGTAQQVAQGVLKDE
jgi:hypothetical protein